MDIFLWQCYSISSGNSGIEDVANAQPILESRRAPSNKRKALKKLSGPGTNQGISTTESGCVTAVVVASIDYHETDMNNSEVDNGKRKQANKKQCIAISLADLFGDKRYHKMANILRKNYLELYPACISTENEPAETVLDHPQVSIETGLNDCLPHGPSTVPVLPTRTAFQHTSSSPIIERYYWLFFLIEVR